MNIFFVTIVKDGMPFITWHYPMMRQLPFDWQWFVVEGAAAPENCTSWCAPIKPGLSMDGTTQYLDSLSKFDRRVVHLRNTYWHGKVNMFNAALEYLQEPSLLWQIDSDEIWRAEHMVNMERMFQQNPKLNCAYFFCRYFVGADIVITTRNGYGNNLAYEWNRVWKLNPGARFKTHEPPCLENFVEKPFLHSETEKAGLVFDHYAYATEEQVRFKSEYYGSPNNKLGHLYKDAVKGWRRLQENNKWPVNLKDFMPWVGDGVKAVRI
jgi:hypothetical protein